MEALLEPFVLIMIGVFITVMVARLILGEGRKTIVYVPAEVRHESSGIGCMPLLLIGVVMLLILMLTAQS